MVKINLTNNSITYKSIKQNNEAIKNNKKSNKLDKLFIYGTPIVVAISSAIFLKKTSKEYIEKIVKDKVIDEKIKERKYLFKNFEIESFKNNEKVKTLDELSGLQQLKELMKQHQIIAENKDIAKEHNVEKISSLLLWGVPGTGKTSAAMGIAKTIDADFIRLDKELFDSEFISKGPRQLAELFRNIKEYAKSNENKNIVIFMDEIDSTIAIDKGLESKQDDVMVNTLKQGMSDLQTECNNVIFIGATNKDPSGFKSDNKTVKLNNAILSRFNYQFEIGLPEKSAIKDAWSKLVKTQSGKEKFTEKENELISETFHKLGMSYRDIKNISNKLNIDDAVEFCKKRSYNSKANLIQALKDDEKVGYDHIKKVNMDTKIKDKLISDLEKKLSEK